MYEEPSFYNVSESELDEGINHARNKFPAVQLDREKLRSIFDGTSRRMLSPSATYVVVFRYVLQEHYLKEGALRNAYKSAVAKIRSNRTSAQRKPLHASCATRCDVEPNEVLISDTGPLWLHEVQEELAIMGLGTDEYGEEILPMIS